MERLETIVVQLEECKRFILSGRVAHLRLALILLDNAGEILMQRSVAGELQNDEFYARMHLSIDRTDASVEEKAKIKSKLGYELLSKGRKWKLDRLFPEKAQFLSRDRDLMPKETADVLCYLHGYRNEAQHDEKLRPGSLRPAVLVLFEIVCDLLVLLGAPTGYSSDGDYRWADAYGLDPPQLGEGACLKIVAQLRDGLPLNIREIGSSLSAHVEDRIEGMIDGLGFISEPRLSLEETLKGLQFWDADRCAHGPYQRDREFHEFRPAYTLESLEQWRGSAVALRAYDEKLSLFRAFANIEQEMEHLELLVEEVVRLVDQAAQAAVDLELGK